MGNISKLLLTFGIITTLLLQQIPVCATAAESSLWIDVGNLGCKSASFSVGEWHRWYIRSSLTDDWENISDLMVFQTLSPALTLETGSISVSLIREDGERILLRMEEHYQLTSGSVFVEEGTADRICIELTREGMDFLSRYQTDASELLISYRAKINNFAEMGAQILGTAQRNQTDTNGDRRIILSDKSAVSVGGFSFNLQDSVGNPLEQESFMLAREADQKEILDDTVTKELLDTGDQTIAVVYERFFTSETITGKKTDRAVTDETGSAVCAGLAYGTYYLVQTESFRENLLPSKPVKVIVDETSHLTASDGWRDSTGNTVDKTVHVTATMVVMPQTGGSGTVSYTDAGGAVVFCACILLWYNRKRKMPVS